MVDGDKFPNKEIIIMIHHKRRYQISTKTSEGPISTPRDLANILAGHRTWCLCNAFQLEHLIFFNDAFSEDGAQEYAVYDSRTKRQIESLTCSWMTKEELEKSITRILAGEYGEGWEAEYPSNPHPEGSCHHCA
jgi:hypothetical protein